MPSEARSDADLTPMRRGRGRARRAPAMRRGFPRTLQALERLASDGAVVSVHAVDVDDQRVVLAGDDHLVTPVAGLGVVPLLLDVATAFRTGRLHPADRVTRTEVRPTAAGGLWNALRRETSTLGDLAVLAAGAGDPVAANALLGRVGVDRVNERLAELGLRDIAVLDGFRDTRGPDDAPDVAVGSTREFARLFGAIAGASASDPTVSAQVAAWLGSARDLGLVGAATGLDPSGQGHDRHGLSLLNRTGRADGVHAEAGVLTGPRAGVAFAMTVCFDDLSVSHRLRVHDAFRTFGVEVMEYVH